MCGVTAFFNIQGEFLDLAEMKSTTDGKRFYPGGFEDSRKISVQSKETDRTNNRWCICDGRKTKDFVKIFWKHLDHSTLH